MCGIIGYIGKRDAVPVLLQGLRALEYRGYDSAGMAVFADGEIMLRKRQGRLSVLADSLQSEPLKGMLGIGHTRWATHGLPNEKNAHPHMDCSGSVAVVHNGIIENFTELKSRLVLEGHRFRSQTDTEVLIHLIEQYDQGDVEKALRSALREVQGTYAIALIHRRHPDLLFGARSGSPLVIGYGNGENFLASDVLAFFHYTKRVTYLDDGEVALLRKNSVSVRDLRGRTPEKRLHRMDWNVPLAQKEDSLIIC